MEQITAFFEGINWDNVMDVVVDYITPIDVQAACDSLFELFLSVVSIFLGNIISF